MKMIALLGAAALAIGGVAAAPAEAQHHHGPRGYAHGFRGHYRGGYGYRHRAYYGGWHGYRHHRAACWRFGHCRRFYR